MVTFMTLLKTKNAAKAENYIYLPNTSKLGNKTQKKHKPRLTTT